MPLSDIVNVQISILSAGVSVPGFGIALILSHNTGNGWAINEWRRVYNNAADVLTDFPDNAGGHTPEYLAASALFDQEVPPSQIMIGKATGSVTQQYTCSVGILAPGAPYTIFVQGQKAEYQSLSSDANDDIMAGLEAAVQALTFPIPVTCALSGSTGSKVLTVTASSSQNWFEVYSAIPGLTNVKQSHADPGITTSLNNINQSDSSWYCLVTLWNSDAYIQSAAAWVEANNKMYIAASCDSAIPTTALGTGTDIAQTLKGLSYFRTAVIYHERPSMFADAAWDGNGLPTTPGSETWKFWTLVGVSPSALNGTDVTNLKAKNCNYYYSVANKGIVADGKMASGEWIDVIRFRDWLSITIQTDLFVALTQGAGQVPGLTPPQKKIPYTDGGIGILQNVITADLDRGVKSGGLASTPKPQVNVPLVKDVPSIDKSARVLNGITFTATLAGAIHAVNVAGTITE